MLNVSLGSRRGLTSTCLDGQGITVALSNGEAVVDVDGVLYARPVNGLSDAAIDAGRAAGKRLVARGER
jgi:hypothetical protein